MPTLWVDLRNESNCTVCADDNKEHCHITAPWFDLEFELLSVQNSPCFHVGSGRFFNFPSPSKTCPWVYRLCQISPMCE